MSRAAATAASAAQRLRAALAANPRLRAGAWATMGILLIYALLLQSDRLHAAHAAYVAVASQLARAQGLAAADDWPRRLEAEQAREGELAQRFWQAESPGLAQARLQAMVAAMVDDLNFRNPIVQAGLSRPAPDMPGVWQAQAQFSGLYRDNPGAELEVIRALAASPQKLVIDRLQMRRRDTRLNVLFSAYFLGVAAPADAGEGA